MSENIELFDAHKLKRSTNLKILDCDKKSKNASYETRGNRLTNRFT